ncbi:fungal-specific transcription factor domain-containing protein [Pilobolus umbonatus]|nr:fungal-specific transcription factor domain-containing protein [Pilobolus umbonatus]
MPPKEKEKLAGSREEQAKNKKSTGNQKRQKIVKACKDCRRRKVKCDGATPCGTCKRSSIACIFESTTPKRGTSKHYFESLENRIFMIERALTSLGGHTMQFVDDAIRRQHMLDEQGAQDITGQQDTDTNRDSAEDRFMINEIGQASYVQDITATLENMAFPNYRIPDSQSIHSPSNNTTRLNAEGEDEAAIQANIQFYMNEIQPIFPLFVPTYFNHQYAANEIPRILIYAICALASYYSQNHDDEMYHSKVMVMLDEAVGRPSVHLIQTLLILIKYTECINNGNFFEKTKNLMARTIEMCKVLELHQTERVTSPDPAVESETKKRTFCMLFTYNTLLCVEQGIESDMRQLQFELSSVLPSYAANDLHMECQTFVIRFSHTMSLIHSHLRRITKRQELQGLRRNNPQIVEENMLILKLQMNIESDLMQLPSHLVYSNSKPTTFPAEEIVVPVSPMVRMVHMLYHLNVILLHFHYFKNPLPQGSNKITPYPHRTLCIAAASNLIRLTEGLMLDPTQRYQYGPRGLQFVAYCIASALAVLCHEIKPSSGKDSKPNKVSMDEYQKCIHLSQRIASASPSIEMRSYARDTDLASINYQLAHDLKLTTLDNSSVSSTSPSPIQTYPSQPMTSLSNLPNGGTSTTSTNDTILNTPTTNTPTNINPNIPFYRDTMKPRRNTISERPAYNGMFTSVPQSLLHLSSSDVSQMPMLLSPSSSNSIISHQPLHNIHTTPLQIHTQATTNYPKTFRSLRGAHTQSYDDLKNVSLMQQNIHPYPTSNTGDPNSPLFTHQQHRRPTSSVISGSTVSTNQPYRHHNSNPNTTSNTSNSSSPVSSRNHTISSIPGVPYNKPVYHNGEHSPIFPPNTSQSTGYRQLQTPGKIRRVRKSLSSTGLSSQYQPASYYYPSQPQQSMYVVQDERRLYLEENTLHRPYQPTLDYDQTKMMLPMEDFPMEEFSFLSPLGDDIQRTEGHQLL